VRGTRSKIISARGGSRRWTMIVKQVVAEEPVCWLRFPRCTIRSQTADHYWPQKYRPDFADGPVESARMLQLLQSGAAAHAAPAHPPAAGAAGSESGTRVGRRMRWDFSDESTDMR
jgi:hypothetical protein